MKVKEDLCRESTDREGNGWEMNFFVFFGMDLPLFPPDSLSALYSPS